MAIGLSVELAGLFEAEIEMAPAVVVLVDVFKLQHKVENIFARVEMPRWVPALLVW